MTQPPPGPPPQAILFQIMAGPIVARSVWAVTELGIPDRLARGPLKVEDLAGDLGLDADALGRMMAMLCTVGIFVHGEAGYANGPLGEALRSDVPASARDHVRYAGLLPLMLVWDRVLDVLRTGRPAAADALGADPWEYLRTHAEFGERFHRAQTSMTAVMTPSVVAAADLAGVRSMVDVGGGQGILLAAFLSASPALRGVLFDQASALDEARALLARQGVADRCELVSGDFFASIPSGHDAYLLKHILHDWSDERAREILATCRRAVRPDSQLWIVEAVLPEGAQPHPARILDLHMMVMFGGRERTEPAWRALLASAGFALAAIRPTPGPASLIVARPA